MFPFFQVLFSSVISDPFVYTDDTKKVIASVNAGYSVYEIPDIVTSFEKGTESSFPFKAVKDSSFEVKFTENSQLEVILEYCFYHCWKMTRINLESCHKLKQIHAYSFSYSGISSIILPESFESFVGWYSFAKSDLESITFKSINCYLGAGTFWMCPKLTIFPIKQGFSFPSGETFGHTSIKEFVKEGDNSKLSIWQGSIYSKDFSTLICHKKVCDKYEIHQKCTTIEWLSFCGCNSSLLTVPSHITSFGTCAFYGFLGTEIQLPPNIKTIPERLFHYTPNLEIVTIPEGVESIEDGAFSSCPNVRVLRLPHSLQTIGPNVFTRFKVVCVLDCPSHLAHDVLQQLPGTRDCFVGRSLNCGTLGKHKAERVVISCLLLLLLQL